MSKRTFKDIYCCDSFNDLVEYNEQFYKSKRKIIGEAGEEYIYYNYKCPYCDYKFYRMQANTPSYDLICSNHMCKKKIQVKTMKKPSKNFIKNIITKQKIKISGSEYKTTLRSINNNREIDFIILIYDEYIDGKHLDAKLHVKSENIYENCIEPANPLGSHTRNPGWQGCYLTFNDFDIELL